MPLPPFPLLEKLLTSSHRKSRQVISTGPSAHPSSMEKNTSPGAFPTYLYFSSLNSISGGIACWVGRCKQSSRPDRMAGIEPASCWWIHPSPLTWNEMSWPSIRKEICSHRRNPIESSISSSLFKHPFTTWRFPYLALLYGCKELLHLLSWMGNPRGPGRDS